MKCKSYKLVWKSRYYGVDPHCILVYLQDDEDSKDCKGTRRLKKSLKTRPDPWMDISEKRRKYRSWKAHCKCRHQWEMHEAPEIDSEWCWDSDGTKGDHRRKWVMDCLRKKGVCIFNVHHDKGLEDFLEGCENWSIRRLGYGLIEATLLVQEVNAPKPRKSPGEKKRSGRNLRHARHHERIKRRKASILAVKERIRRASRKGGKGVSRPRVPYVCKSRVKHILRKNGTGLYRPTMKYNAHGEAVVYWTWYDAIYAAALEDRIKGVARKNSASSYLLMNYSSYRPMAKARCGLDEYDHDYKQFHTALEQCCVWLTGRRVSEFPAWCMGMLTESRLPDDVAKRIWNWMLGFTYVRDVYGLSKNEAREIIRLPGSIGNENEAVVAAIAAARHCDETLAMNLARQVPAFGDVVKDPIRRDFVRRLVEWLIAVKANPIAGKLHDMLDYFFHSGIWRDTEFSFKGRTLQRVEALMREWHHERIMRGGMTVEEFKAKWEKHDLDCNVSPYSFKELLSAQELLEEGNKQHNCVFSYRSLCKSGISSIVSMRGTGQTSNENLTLEIRERRIVQIRGACNRLPYKEEMRVVRTFASLKNLVITCITA